MAWPTQAAGRRDVFTVLGPKPGHPTRVPSLDEAASRPTGPARLLNWLLGARCLMLVRRVRAHLVFELFRVTALRPVPSPHVLVLRLCSRRLLIQQLPPPRQSLSLPLCLPWLAWPSSRYRGLRGITLSQLGVMAGALFWTPPEVKRSGCIC